MSKLLDGLNPSQREAVTHTIGPLLIIAGPGSGKTRTVVHSIAYAIENGVQPDRILAFSFTVKASQELRERVTRFVGEEAQLVNISTFHSFCRKVLKEDIGRLRRTDALNFQGLDEDEQEKADQRRVAQAINHLQYKSVKSGEVHNFIIKCKTLGIRPSEAKNHTSDPKYAEIYEKYEQRLKEDGWIDYPNQLLFTDELLTDVPEVKKKWQEEFDLIFVDEYQDTDPVQYRIIKTLAEKHQNLRVVGDDDQGIYGWRGADIQNILNFENDYPTDKKLITLGQNYRSTQRIVEASRALVEFNPDRRQKDLFTRNLKGEKVKHLHCKNNHVEADTIADFISRSIKEGRNPSDFAVLYRINKQAKPFKTAFDSLGIPFHEMKKSSDRNVHGVSIMTIHKSKGLEFPNVFVVGVCKDLLPNYYSRDEKDWGEELRLLYVAMTRAKNWLCLSSYDYYQKYERGQSPFLERGYIPSSLLESVETLESVISPPSPPEMTVPATTGETAEYVEPLPEKLQGNKRERERYEAGCDDLDKKQYERAIGEHAKAVNSLKCAIAINPDYQTAYHNLAHIYFEMGNLQDASKTVVEASRLDTNNQNTLRLLKDIQDAYSKQGSDYFRRGNLAAAENSAKKALTLDSNYQPAHKLLNDIKQTYYEQGLACIENSAHAEAISALKKTVKIDPDFKEARYSLGQTYFTIGDLEAAEKEVGKVLRIDAQDELARCLLISIKEGYYNRGLTSVKQNEWKAAEKSAEGALRIDRNYKLAAILLKNAYCQQALAHEKSERYDRSVNLLQKAENIDPNCEKTHYYLGRVYFKIGRLKEAQAHANKALSIQPNYSPSQKLLKEIKNAPNWLKLGGKQVQRLVSRIAKRIGF